MVVLNASITSATSSHQWASAKLIYAKLYLAACWCCRARGAGGRSTHYRYCASLGIAIVYID